MLDLYTGALEKRDYDFDKHIHLTDLDVLIETDD